MRRMSKQSPPRPPSSPEARRPRISLLNIPGVFAERWQRTTGYALLAIVVFLIIGWLRSNSTGDAILVPLGIRQHAFSSIGGRVYWWGVTRYDGEFGWKPSHQSVRETLAALDHTRNENEKDAGAKFSEWVVPYWAIVVPLLLMASGLILWKPRQTAKAEVPRSAPSQ
jgi:hypothetical protein